MMFDIKLFNVCDHKISGVELPITGTSPSYIGVLPIGCDGNRNTIFIRSYNDEEQADVVSNYKIGITNYTLDSDKQQILFGTYPVEVGTRFPDVREGLIPENLYYVDYISDITYCPRCLGTGIVFDSVFDSSGKLVEVTGSEKLKQEVIKILLTSLGNNTHDTSYGSDLQSLIGSALDQYSTVLIQKYINDSMNYLMIKQNGTNLPDNERYLNINSLDITLGADGLSYIIVLTIMNMAYETITINLSMSKSGTVS